MSLSYNNESLMEYNYEPLSEEQAQKERFQLLEDGDYEGIIEFACGKISRSHNPMGVFTVRVWDKEGRPKEITDYITFTNSMIWKLRHLCGSTGLIKEFEEKKFRPEITIGKKVLVRVRTSIGTEIPSDKLNGKPIGSKYPDKNVIEDYLMTIILNKEKIVEQKSVESKEFFNDDIPF